MTGSVSRSGSSSTTARRIVEEGRIRIHSRSRRVRFQGYLDCREEFQQEWVVRIRTARRLDSRLDNRIEGMETGHRELADFRADLAVRVAWVVSVETGPKS